MFLTVFTVQMCECVSLIVMPFSVIQNHYLLSFVSPKEHRAHLCVCVVVVVGKMRYTLIIIIII